MSTSSTSLDEIPAWELAESFRTRAVGVVEYVAFCLERIDRLDPVLRSFVTVDGVRALDRAQQVQEQIDRSEAVDRPLLGLPIGLKDEIWTTGLRSTAGSRLYENFVPEHDATVVEQLRRDGSIVLGKTNMPEFASFPRSANAVAGECVNPYDPSRISGASSGGSAAALAAGLVPLAIGSDGGGSTRIPAALCGVVGLHPTPGLVPDTHTFSYSPHASLGPMARHVRDVALLLGSMVGATSPAEGYARHLADGVQGLRVAWSPDLGHVEVADPRIVHLARDAALGLEHAGARLDEPGLVLPATFEILIGLARGGPHFGDPPLPYLHTPEVQERRGRYGILLSPHNRAPARPDRSEFVAAGAQRERLRARLHAFFQEHDLLLTPTMPEIAPTVPDTWTDPYARHFGTSFTAVVNLAGLCAATVPCGLVDGMPVGVQVIGPPFAEERVLAACRVLEESLPRLPRPALSSGVGS